MRRPARRYPSQFQFLARSADRRRSCRAVPARNRCGGDRSAAAAAHQPPAAAAGCRPPLTPNGYAAAGGRDGQLPRGRLVRKLGLAHFADRGKPAVQRRLLERIHAARIGFRAADGKAAPDQLAALRRELARLEATNIPLMGYWGIDV